MSKLSDSDILEIRELLEQGIKHSDIAEMFEVHPDTITKIAADVETRARKVRVRIGQNVVDEIIKRRNAGENAKEIAADLNLHWSTVYRECRKAGIKGR